VRLRWPGWLERRWEAAADRVAWVAAREAVEAVRYQPPHLKLLLACGASQPDVPQGLARWLVETPARPALRRLSGLPHAAVRAVAARAALWFGPTASALVRFSSGATAAAADRMTAEPLERRMRASVHPGLLVPHRHDVAVLAVDMRGFSELTRALDDTQYLANLIEEYLTTMTRVVEDHRGVVFQYTGDGLLALFLPELAAAPPAALLRRLVHDTARTLHEEFDAAHARWRAEWTASGRGAVAIGLGLGVSFGRVTMGFIGASGKKHFGAIGECVNLAALLCSEAEGGTALVDLESFARAGCEAPRTRIVRVRSRKLRRRLDAVSLRYGARQPGEPFAWLPRAGHLRPPQ
jgi:class 3 adenylate cyclase